MSFKHLVSEGLTETHCDGASHLAITKPDHAHSGVPLAIEESDCNCPDPEAKEPAKGKKADK
jgi:hypothetical protein